MRKITVDAVEVPADLITVDDLVVIADRVTRIVSVKHRGHDWTTFKTEDGRILDYRTTKDKLLLVWPSSGVRRT